MRILYITPYFPDPTKKAGSKFTFNQLKILKNLGHKIDLVSVTKLNDLDIDHLQNICNKVFIYKRKKNKLSYLKALGRSFFFKESFFLNLINKDMVQKISFLLKKYNYVKIFLEHSYMGIWFIQTFGDNYNDKLRIVLHNIEKDYFEYMFKKEELSLLKLFYYLEYRFLLYKEKNILRCRTCKLLFYNKKDAEKYNGIFLPSYPFKIKRIEVNDKYDIGFIGLLSNKRNIQALDYFLEKIFPLIIKKRPHVRFAIAGKNIRKSDLKKLKRYRNVIFLGEIDNLEKFYSECKIIVVPILESIGVQTKLYEALSYLKPVVCTEYALNGTPFENSKHLLATNNSVEFAKCCIELLEKEKKVECFKKNLIQMEETITCLTRKALEA